VEHEDTILETYENADKISSLDHKVSRRSFLFAGLLSVIGVATAGSFFFPQNGKAQASGGVSNLVGSGSFDIGSKDYQIDTTGDLSLTDKGVPTSGAVKSFLQTQVSKSLKEIITKDGIAANYIKIDSKSLSFQTTNVQNAIEQLDTRIEVLQKDSHKPVTASDNSILVGSEQQLKVNASGIPFNATINGGIVTNLQDFLNVSTATLNTITSLGGVNEGVNEGQAAFINRADLYNRKDGTRLYFRTLTSTDSSVLFTQAGDGKTIDLKINLAAPGGSTVINGTYITTNTLPITAISKISKNRILGYAGTISNPATGDVEEIELGNGLEFDTSVTPNKLVVNLATSIPNLPVNSISNVGPVSLVGNSSGVTAAAQTIALGNDFLFDTLTNPTLPQLKLNPTSTSAIWSLQNVPVPTYVTLNDPNLIVRLSAINKIGIGTTTPGTNLVIDTGTSANSGLQLSQLNSASLPIASSSILGVDAGGKVNKIGILTGNANKFLQINPTGDGLISSVISSGPWENTLTPGTTKLVTPLAATNTVKIQTATGAIVTVSNDGLETTGTTAASFSSENGPLLVTDRTTPAKRISIGYDATLDTGYISALQSGLAWKNLALQGGGGGTVSINKTNANSTLDVNGGIRANYGLPTNDLNNTGYAFADNGDTGMFAQSTAPGTGSVYFYNNANNIAGFDSGRFSFFAPTTFSSAMYMGSGGGNAGTTGQILTSQGTGNAPVWTDAGLLFSTGLYSASGNSQTLTAQTFVCFPPSYAFVAGKTFEFVIQIYTGMGGSVFGSNTQCWVQPVAGAGYTTEVLDAPSGGLWTTSNSDINTNSSAGGGVATDITVMHAKFIYDGSTFSGFVTSQRYNNTATGDITINRVKAFRMTGSNPTFFGYTINSQYNGAATGIVQVRSSQIKIS
jgi:hypothetical protein